MTPGCWASVVVPTRDSARWIRPIVRAYAELGLAPLFIVDRASRDGTAAAIRAAGGRLCEATLAQPRVEALIPELRRLVQPGWVFRVDDDEFPSRGLAAWLRGAPPAADLDSVAVQRRWLRRGPDGVVEVAHCSLWRDATGEVGGDHQWRAFHTERVAYRTDIHTPGFLPGRWDTAPASAYLVHLNWMLRSAAERRARMAEYDAQCAGSGARHWMYYLPEVVHPRDLTWRPLPAAEIAGLLADLPPPGWVSGHAGAVLGSA